MSAKRIALIAGIVVVALIAILAAIPFVIPASQYRAGLEKAATEGLGRDVKVNGALRFSVFPTLGLNAKQVTIANRQGGAAPLFANIDDLDVGVALGPLLGGKVEVTKLVLKNPVLALEADAGGKPNWVFDAKPDAPAKTEAERAKDLEKLGFGDLRVENGQVTYRDKRGAVQAISAVNAAVALKSINAPFSLKSDFSYHGDPVKLSLDAPTPRAFAEKKPTLISVLIEAEKLTAKLEGTVDPVTMAVSGRLDAKGPSIRKLAAWTGSPIGEGGGLAQFAVIGDLNAEGPRTALSNASIVVDQAKGRGNIIITTKDGAPPYVQANVILDALDVNPYLGAPQTPGAARAAEGVNVQQGWGADRIDLSGLKAINADMVIKTGQLTFQKMKFDRADMNVSLEGGVMRATMNRIDLYGGAGSGVLVLDARGDALRIENALKLGGVNAKAFLTDAIGFDKIEGAANIDVSIYGAGATQQAIMNALGGRGVVAFEDGAIVGVDLAQIARQVQSALTGEAVGPAAKTDFAELAASFQITKGVASTKDFRLLNPFVRINGAGDINVAQQTMNMKITPRAVKSIEGQGGKQEVEGIGVPFNVTGPWAKLKFSPDLAGLVQERFGSEIDKLKQGLDTGGLGALFGQKPKPAPAPTPAP